MARPSQRLYRKMTVCSDWEHKLEGSCPFTLWTFPLCELIYRVCATMWLHSEFVEVMSGLLKLASVATVKALSFMEVNKYYAQWPIRNGQPHHVTYKRVEVASGYLERNRLANIQWPASFRICGLAVKCIRTRYNFREKSSATFLEIKFSENKISLNLREMRKLVLFYVNSFSQNDFVFL